MGRAGGGSSSGGSHHSGGGHSVGRSSGGHSVGSSSRSGGSRAGSGSSRPGGSSGFGGARPGGAGGFGGAPGGRRGTPPPPPRGGFGAPPPPPRRPAYGWYGRRRRGGGCFGGVFSFLIVILVILWVLFAFLRVSLIGTSSFLGSFTGGSAKSSVSSTINREPLTDSAAFINDCIVDELGWFDNISSTERQLQDFYKATGVQPFIVLHEYDPALTSYDDKEQWAEEYYEENIDNENTFLYVYFAEFDTDNDVGYMCYVNGVEVSAVMDSEAIEIFWNYIDQYWYSDLSTDDLFVTVFNRTADTIMRVSTTGADVAKTALLVIGVVVVLLVIFAWWRARAKREKERAEETERILNTPMQDLVNESRADDLAKKYDNL